MAMGSTQEDLTPDEAAELAGRGEIQLVDVRERREWDEGRLAGARHVELNRLTEEAGSLAAGEPIVFYCRTGGRSAVATQAFRASGLPAYNLAGGLVAWVARGLPLEPVGGRVADH